MMRRAALFSILALTLWADANPGLRPRREVTDYPAQASQDGLTLGAVVLSPDEVRHAFATDLNKGYIVVEVGVYPGASAAELHTVDFSLRVGANQAALRPVTGEAIAAALTRSSSSSSRRTPSSDVNIYPTATIGYETGRSYDPVTGRTRNGGWYGGTGVAVTSGTPGSPAPAPSQSDRNRPVMRVELEDKALPEGTVTQPAAGYLYFPLPTGKRRAVAYELIYDGPSSRAKLALPPPSGK